MILKILETFYILFPNFNRQESDNMKMAEKYFYGITPMTVFLFFFRKVISPLAFANKRAV